MKILHVLAQLPCKTGSGVYYCNIIDRFKAYGHEQRALFASQDGIAMDILPSADRYPVYFRTDNLPFPIAGMSDVMPYENTVYSQMDDSQIQLWKKAFLSALEQAKEEFNPDVVISHHLWMLTSMVTSVFDNCITVGLCHNTDIRQAEQNPDMRIKHAPNLDKLDLVFSLSAGQHKKIADTFNIDSRKITVAGGGFDEKLFFPLAEKHFEGEIRIVYAGKLVPSKGIYELIRVFERLSQEDSSIYLEIIGTPNPENAKRLQEEIGGSSRIHLYQAENQRALAERLRAMDIFVMPSFFEGLGLMAVESLASGLWTVTTEIEGLQSLLGERINSSGIINYVKMPRVFDTDKPYPKDIPEFEENLRAAILSQIEKVKRKEKFPPWIKEEILGNSWQGVAARINRGIMKRYTLHNDRMTRL